MEEDWDCSVLTSSLICEEDHSLLDDDFDDHELRLNDSNLFESEDEYIEILFLRESSHLFFRGDSLHKSDDAWLKWARSDAIKWIMKYLNQTRAYFGFGYQTAYLAITYYDRFLMRRSIEKERSWIVQLLSTACLSLAAKMEECAAPPISEYQSEECKFDSNTIQRMELLILSTLDWCMSSVTPFDYLSHFKSKLQNDIESKGFLSNSIGFIFAIIDDVNLVDHRPSTIAAAVVLAAFNQRLNKQLVESKLRLLSSCTTLNLENVFSCYETVFEKSQKKLEASRVICSSVVITHLLTIEAIREEDCTWKIIMRNHPKTSF